MRVVFMGTPDYATIILKELLNSAIEVPLVVTQPDKPVGRKQLLTPPHIKKWVLENSEDIEIYQPKTLKNAEAKEKIESYNPDFIVVAAYGQILPLDILNIATCINLHASLLPKYRGASPIQNSILKADEFTGVTAMLMEKGLDSGDILAFRYIALKDKLVGELFDELSNEAAKLTLKVLYNFEKIKPIKQIDADATYCAKINKDDGKFDFNSNAKQIFIKYKAYTPWPGISLESGLKIKELALADAVLENAQIGIITKISKSSITVTCRVGLLEIFKVQAPSKKEIRAVDYVRGKRFEIGSKLV